MSAIYTSGVSSPDKGKNGLRVESFNVTSGFVYFGYNDGAELHISPIIKEPNQPQAEIQSVVLYNGGRAENAAAIKKVESPETTFWASNGITPQGLAEYLSLAIQTGEGIFRDYLKDRLKIEDWANGPGWPVWMTTRSVDKLVSALANETVKVAKEKPVVDLESIAARDVVHS